MSVCVCVRVLIAYKLTLFSLVNINISVGCSNYSNRSRIASVYNDDDDDDGDDDTFISKYVVHQSVLTCRCLITRNQFTQKHKHRIRYLLLITAIFVRRRMPKEPSYIQLC